MLKNILKTSISAFALLGTLSRLDSSYAMDEEKKNKWSFLKKKKSEKSEKNLVSSKPKDRIEIILTPFKKEDFLFPKKIIFENFTGEKGSDFEKLPNVIKPYIFSFLDPKSMLIAERVCKGWYPLIHTYIEKLENQLPEKFLAHPAKILEILDKLAPLFPYQPLNLKSDKDSEILMENFSDNRLQFLNNMARAIKNFPGCHYFLVRTFMNLSPCEDFQKVGLASLIIKEVPALQDILREIIQKTIFEIDEFADICNKSSKYPAPHMQALKLLSLSGDENAQKRMEEFIHMYGQKNIDSFALIDKKENGNKICHFWTSFTDDQELLSRTLGALKHFWNSPHKEDLKLKLHMDMGELEAMGNYIFSIHSELKDECEILFYQYLQRIYDLKGQKAPLLPILDEKTLQNFKTPNDFLDQTYRFILREQHEEVDKTLNVALDKFSKSPSYFYILQVKIENILRSGNKEKFDKAEKCIETLIKAFGGKDILESPLTEGGKEKIHRSDIYVLQAALYIFKKQFKEAYQSLALGLTEDRIREMFECLLPALQTHLSIIPKEIIKLLRQNQSISNTISHPLPYNNSYKYGDVYLKLHKNPFKKLVLTIKNKKNSKIISKETKKQNDMEDKENNN